jgi:hypothetical protein
MRPDDLDPWFEVYEWHPRETLTALLRSVEKSRVSGSRGVALSNGSGEEYWLQLPVTFGGALNLLGYDLRTPVVSSGDEIELLTLWKVTNPELVQAEDLVDVEGEPVFFVHALDRTGTPVAQEDRLDAPAWAWREGDRIAQIHRLSLPPTLPEGSLILAVGVYRRTDMSRLSVSMDGRVIGDAVFFSPVDVTE